MYNKAILIGRLTADPELKQTPNGISVCSFRIACNRPYSSKSGERTADFINIVAWRAQAEFVARYFKKGNAIGVEGSIQTRDYNDKNGEKRYVTEIVGDNFFFVESKNASQGSSDGASYFAPPETMPMGVSGSAYSSGKAEDFQEIDDDDDLPF